MKTDSGFYQLQRMTATSFLQELQNIRQSHVSETNDFGIELLNSTIKLFDDSVIEELKIQFKKQAANPSTRTIIASCMIDMSSVMNKGHKLYVTSGSAGYTAIEFRLEPPFTICGRDSLRHIYGGLNPYKAVVHQLYSAFPDSAITLSVLENGNLQFEILYRLEFLEALYVPPSLNS